MENGDVSMENGVFSRENCDFIMEKVFFPWKIVISFRIMDHQDFCKLWLAKKWIEWLCYAMFMDFS